MRFLKKIILALLFVCLLILPVYAGEKEERSYEVTMWQEHIKALQLEIEISQMRLKEAMAKKQAFEAKQQENENTEKETK